MSIVIIKHEIIYLHPRYSRISRNFLPQVPKDVLIVQTGCFPGERAPEGMVNDVLWCMENNFDDTLPPHVPSVYIKENENGFCGRVLIYSIDFTCWNDITQWIKDNQSMLDGNE